MTQTVFPDLVTANICIAHDQNPSCDPNQDYNKLYDSILNSNLNSYMKTIIIHQVQTQTI